MTDATVSIAYHIIAWNGADSFLVAKGDDTAQVWKYTPDGNHIHGPKDLQVWLKFGTWDDPDPDVLPDLTAFNPEESYG